MSLIPTLEEKIDAAEAKSEAALAGATGYDATAPREKRQWWAVADHDVRQVTGYSCAPNNPDMWWCPEAGYSMSEKHHLFTTEEDAINKAIGELETVITTSRGNIEALEMRKKLRQHNGQALPQGGAKKGNDEH